MYEKELETLGLAEKETRVYVASLELGPETVQNIAKKAGVNRPTTYVQIESLKRKGLMSEFDKGKKTYFMAESPERLGGLLNVFQNQLDLKKAELQRILPALSDIFGGIGEKPKVRFFEGREGIETMRDDLWKDNQEVHAFVNLDKVFQYFPNQDEHTEKRANKSIRSNVIYTHQTGPVAGANDPTKLRTAKFVDSARLPITADISISRDKVTMFSYKENPIGVMIQNQQIADTFRSIFLLIWAFLG